MKKEFKNLIGKELTLLDLSNDLQALKCEDIGYFGNWPEILESGNVVVAIDNQGENHIQIYFNVTIEAGQDEDILATYIKITDIQDF